MSDFALARHNMVESQIRTNKVTDPAIIEAFEAVPREIFVPRQMRGVAYVDGDLALGGGRTLMEPMIFARLLQAALPDRTDQVLDVACGCGYSTAILSHVAGTVYGVEADGDMVAGANERLGSLDVDNAAVIAGDPLDGYTRKAPFSLIVIAGGVERIPESLVDQLDDGGRLVTILYGDGTPHGGGARQGTAVLVEKFGAPVSRRIIFDASVPLLPEFREAPKFVF